MKFISFNQLPLYTDDFFWRELNDNNRDAIVVFNPADALIVSPVFLRSRKTLDEHIEYIRKNDIKKAIVVAEDINFLKQCPGLEYLKVYPAVEANEFDYSPIYEMPNIKWLQCQTIYGVNEDKVSTIDYSRFHGVKRIGVSGGKGHLNVHTAKEVVSLFFDFGFPNAKTLTGFISGEALENFSISQSPIQSLEGIEVASQLRRLELAYNRRLSDISALCHLGETLRYLEIDTCGKIRDFSVLKELHNLEFLILKGSNILPDLSFLKEMPKLKVFHLTMNVEDGDLSLCGQLPYARIKNRKHYSLKDNELPKNYTDPQVIIPFEVI